MSVYVVCMDPYYVRDAQMLDTKRLTDEELEQADPFSTELENHWFDAEVTHFVGAFHAQSEQEACELAAKQHRYDIRSLFATKVEFP